MPVGQEAGDCLFWEISLCVAIRGGLPLSAEFLLGAGIGNRGSHFYANLFLVGRCYSGTLESRLTKADRLQVEMSGTSE